MTPPSHGKGNPEVEVAPATRPALVAQTNPTAPPTQNCPNGICIGGSNSGNPAVYNFGPPPASISSWRQAVTGVDRTQVVLSVDHNLDVPAFQFYCDGPCHPGPAPQFLVMVSGTGSLVKQFFHASDNDMEFELTSPRPLGQGVEVTAEIQGPKAPHVRNVRIVPVDQLPKVHQPSDELGQKQP